MSCWCPRWSYDVLYEWDVLFEYDVLYDYDILYDYDVLYDYVKLFHFLSPIRMRPRGFSGTAIAVDTCKGENKSFHVNKYKRR